MRVCPTCRGERTVIRGPRGGWVAPKLGEAGTDDCPVCDDTGFDLAVLNPAAADDLGESDAA
jgi:hypothetical protein